jgi:hypothetical protein
MTTQRATRARYCVAHHVADVVGDEVRPVDLELVEQARHVVALGFLVVAALGMG